MNTKTKMFEAALNGLTKNSSGADHTWAVVGNDGTYVADLTYMQAKVEAERLNALYWPTGTRR